MCPNIPPAQSQLGAHQRAPADCFVIDGLLNKKLEKQYANLRAYRPQPHMLDNYTVGRVIKVYTEQAGDVGLYEEQLSRWKSLNLTPSERQEVARLSEQNPKNPRANHDAILALAEELKGGTIETVLGKSDLELGLEFLLGKATASGWASYTSYLIGVFLGLACGQGGTGPRPETNSHNPLEIGAEMTEIHPAGPRLLARNRYSRGSEKSLLGGARHRRNDYGSRAERESRPDYRGQ